MMEIPPFLVAYYFAPLSLSAFSRLIAVSIIRVVWSG